MRDIVKIILLAGFVVIFCAVSRSYANSAKVDSIVLAGGCFWGVEAVFEHSRGVIDVVSGYSGGKAETAKYELVTGGDTNHAESVKVTYNPEQISLEQILDIYFTVAHNPTQLNYQGPDYGTQYRSAVFYSNNTQKNVVEAKISELKDKNFFHNPIVTRVEKLEQFYEAEEYHQNYARLNPMNPYIITHDAPKVEKLKVKYPELFKEPQF
jgi:peptide-methionine (S)-S-oxide reductase